MYRIIKLTFRNIQIIPVNVEGGNYFPDPGQGTAVGANRSDNPGMALQM